MSQQLDAFVGAAADVKYRGGVKGVSLEPCVVLGASPSGRSLRCAYTDPRFDPPSPPPAANPSTTTTPTPTNAAIFEVPLDSLSKDLVIRHSRPLPLGWSAGFILQGFERDLPRGSLFCLPLPAGAAAAGGAEPRYAGCSRWAEAVITYNTQEVEAMPARPNKNKLFITDKESGLLAQSERIRTSFYSTRSWRDVLRFPVGGGGGGAGDNNNVTPPQGNTHIFTEEVVPRICLPGVPLSASEPQSSAEETAALLRSSRAYIVWRDVPVSCVADTEHYQRDPCWVDPSKAPASELVFGLQREEPPPRRSQAKAAAEQEEEEDEEEEEEEGQEEESATPAPVPPQQRSGHCPAATACNEAFFTARVIRHKEQEQDRRQRQLHPPHGCCSPEAAGCVSAALTLVAYATAMAEERSSALLHPAEPPVVQGKKTAAERRQLEASLRFAEMFREPPATRLSRIASRVEGERARRLDAFIRSGPGGHRPLKDKLRNKVRKGRVELFIASGDSQIPRCGACGDAKLVWPGSSAAAASQLHGGERRGERCRPVGTLGADMVLSPGSSFISAPICASEIHGALWPPEVNSVKGNAHFALSHLLRVCRLYDAKIDARFKSWGGRDTLRLGLVLCYPVPRAERDGSFGLTLQVSVAEEECVRPKACGVGEGAGAGRNPAWLSQSERKYFLWYIASMRALKVLHHCCDADLTSPDW